MSLNLHLSNLSFDLSNFPSKVSSCQGTDASSPLVIGQHLSFISCASSLSVEEETQHSIGNQLFARYLFAQDQTTKQIYFQKLKGNFQELVQSSPEKVQSFLTPKQENYDEQGKVMLHFIGSWLLFMGYGSSKNKNYFINRIRLLAGESKAYKFAKIYFNFKLLDLTFNALASFLLKTCQNGWEFFIRQLIKMEPKFTVKD